MLNLFSPLGCVFLTQGRLPLLLDWYLESLLTGEVSVPFAYGLDTRPIPSHTATLTTQFALLVHLAWSPKPVTFLFVGYLVCVVLFDAFRDNISPIF